jgi:hypothetical protein
MLCKLGVFKLNKLHYFLAGTFLKEKNDVDNFIFFPGKILIEITLKFTIIWSVKFSNQKN